MTGPNSSVLKPLHLRRHRLSDLEWGLSVAFGAIGLITIGLALLIFAISHSAVARDAVASVLPREVLKWLDPPTTVTSKATNQVIPPEIIELAKRIAAEPKARTTSAPQSFTKQSTKADVIRIHGVPTRVDGDIWYYGPSEVYFTGDQVTGWRSSPTFPLRTR